MSNLEGYPVEIDQLLTLREGAEDLGPRTSITDLEEGDQPTIIEIQRTNELKELQELCDEKKRELSSLEAALKEANVGIVQTRNEKNVFCRKVVLLAHSNPSKMPFTEDVVRYLEHELKRKRFVKERLQKNNHTLRKKVADLEKVLKGKPDLKDVLHEVDFEREKILYYHYKKLEKELHSKRQAAELKHVKSVEALKRVERKLAYSLAVKAHTEQCIRDRSDKIANIQKLLCKRHNLSQMR